MKDRSAVAGASAHRVLVVEDEDAVAAGLRLLLEQEYQVDVASTGQEALAKLSSGVPFDAVLCDLMMPGMSGIELFRILASTRPGVEEKLVFMTGGAFTQRARSHLSQVDNPVIEKPFTRASFQRVVQELLR